jgi:hypothetical protein
VAQNALGVLRESRRLDSDRSDLAVAILTQVDLKKHARYRYGDAGEFLAKRGKYGSRFIEAQPAKGGKDPTAGTHDEQAQRPSVAGEGSDGCAV